MGHAGEPGRAGIPGALGRQGETGEEGESVKRIFRMNIIKPSLKKKIHYLILDLII